MSNDRCDAILAGALGLERFDREFQALIDDLLRDPDGRGIDDVWGAAYWIDRLQDAIYDQELSDLCYSHVGLTFELADMFAVTTFEGEI